MKISKINVNNHKKCFDIVTNEGVSLSFPFSKLEVCPTTDNRVIKVFVDPELDDEAITYNLESGEEDSVHIEMFLEYNRDAEYLRKTFIYNLTLQAEKLIASSELAKREIIRKLSTSPTQFYRILNATNYQKTIDQLFKLVWVLGYDIEVALKEAINQKLTQTETKLADKFRYLTDINPIQNGSKFLGILGVSSHKEKKAA